MAKNFPANVVIRINDREITNSFNGINKEVRRLERELKGAEVGSEKFQRTFNELNEAKRHLERVRREIQGTTEDLKEATEASGGFMDIFKGNVAADFFQNITSKAMELGTQLKERVEQLVKIKNTLSSLDDNLRGANLDRAAVSVQSIADTYDKSIEEIQVAVKALNAQTGDTNKSLDLIKKGFEAGADASGEMLQQIKEYPTMMNDAKVSAEEMIAIIAQSEKMGVYDDKGIDAIKEGMLRVREGTKATKDAMRALGMDVDKIYKQIASGALSYFDVLKMVSARIKEVGADSRITGTAIADIFGGPGEDAGYRYISQLQSIDTNLNNLTGSTNEAVIAKKKELEANERLNGIWVKLTGTASFLSITYSKLKIVLADFLSAIFDIENSNPSQEYIRMSQKLRFLKDTFLAVIAVMSSYRAGLVLTALFTKGAWQQTLIYTAVQKAKVVGENIARASTLLYAAAKAVLTGNIVRATAAMRVFNATTKLNPLGFILSLLTAAVAAFVIFRNRVKEAREEIAVMNREQKLALEIQKGMNKQIIQDVEEMKRKIDPLVRILNDQNTTLKERKNAYDQLIKIAPEFRGTVDKEYFATLKLSSAYGTLIERITNLAKKRALESLTAEKQTALIREESVIDSLQAEKDENTYKMTGVFPGKSWIVDKNFKKLTDLEKNVLINRNKGIDALISASRTKIQDLEKDINNVNNTIKIRYSNILEDPKLPNQGSKDADLDALAQAEKDKAKKAKQDEKDRLKAEKEKEKELEEIEKAEKESHERLLKLQEEYQNSKSEIIEDEFQKETQKEVDRRNQEESNFEKQITELQDRKAKSKSSSEKSDIDKSIDFINKINQTKEEEHRLKMLTIQQKYDAKLFEDFVQNQDRLNNEKRTARENEINSIQTFEDLKQKLSEDQFLKLSDKELRSVKSLEDAKKILRTKADQEFLRSQLITLEKSKQILLSNLKYVSGPLKDQIEKDLAKVNEDIAKIIKDLQGDSGNLDDPKQKIDILGFTAEDWEKVFGNLNSLEGILSGVGTALSALGNAASMYGNLQKALGEKELQNYEKVQNSKKKQLEKSLALGLISQEDYKNKTELIDAELAKKRQELQLKQARAEKTANLFSAIGGVAVGIANSLKVGGPIGIALAAIVGALGAVQIATIAAQPLPELESFAKGGYFEGYTGNSNLPVDETGERPYANVKLHRNEWVAPRWMTEHPQISKDIQRLEFMRANKITSLAEGGFPDPNATPSVASNYAASSTDSTMVQYIAVMNDVKNLLQKLDDEGVTAYIDDNDKTYKKISRGIKSWETLQNKNKH